MANHIVLRMPTASAPKVRALFETHGFEFKDLAHAFWTAKGPSCGITFYRSGKLMLQGKGCAAWHQVLMAEDAEAKPYASALAKHPSPAPQLWIGTDEAGKGDYFGPLVVSGCAVRLDQLDLLQTLAVDDSKRRADASVREIARSLRSIVVFETISISPKRYNELIGTMRTVNNIMIWAHCQVIERLLERTKADFVLVDRFVSDEKMRARLGPLGKATRFAQRPKAEEDPAVAAASILARSAYINALWQLREQFGVHFPGGAAAQTLAAGREFLVVHGRERLGEVGKLHFSTTQQFGG